MAHEHVHGDACDVAHTEVDSACAVAHSDGPVPQDGRTVVAVFSSPVGRSLLHFARDAGFATVLLEPAADRVTDADREFAGTVLTSADDAVLDGDADVVFTDHHRDDLGEVLRDVLGGKPRWIGLMGNPRHVGPHVAMLRELGVPDEDIARVHRPIGLNIGSRTPPEIALSALAGLIADRNGRPGGFSF
jgi:xanthine dehydrogenase accessory factor